jgi:hypothetical protein
MARLPAPYPQHAGVAIREVAEAQPGEAAAEVIGVIL